MYSAKNPQQNDAIKKRNVAVKNSQAGINKILNQGQQAVIQMNIWLL